MKVLLVNPSQYEAYGFNMKPTYPPLGLLYVASVFESEDCKVRFLDIDNERIKLNGISSILKDFNPDIVGITALTPTYINAISIAKIVKQRNEDTKVIFGGIHPTILPLEVIQNEYVDFVIEGEGEISTRELIRQFNSTRPDFTKVMGLWFKQNGKVFNNARPPLVKALDSIDFPAWHLINNPKRYTGQDALRMPIASIITSRGCPGRCTFCQTKNLFGKSFRYRSVQNIIAEIDILVNQFNVKEIHIMDDVLTLKKERILKLCKEIRNRGYDIAFQISNGLRADMVDEDILKALKSIGLINVGFGVETGSDEIMKRIKKSEISKDKVRKVYEIAKRLGFETWAYFIFGLPGETEKTAKETINFAIELNPDFAKFLILKPFPGTEIFEELNNKGLICDHKYSHYGLYTTPVHRLENMSATEILDWQKKAFREFYFRPKKLLSLVFRKWSITRIRKTLHSLNFILKKSL